uniref:Uncharacterized protein n=1 Tax=Anguilla anguilla TaxID=7936 RepID=A0A0E9QNG6_ANGAN
MPFAYLSSGQKDPTPDKQIVVTAMIFVQGDLDKLYANFA